MGYRQFGRVVKASVSGADLSEVVGSNPTAVIFASRTRYVMVSLLFLLEEFISDTMLVTKFSLDTESLFLVDPPSNRSYIVSMFKATQHICTILSDLNSTIRKIKII